MILDQPEKMPDSPNPGPLDSTASDPERHFRTEHLKATLKSRSARGSAVTVGAQGLKFVISMSSTVVLARLLTPQDYGLIGMVIVIIGFISMFKDMGLSLATVQRPEINHRQVSTLFWINFSISVALMLLTMAIAPLVSLFYHEPRLTWITIGLAATFILGGLTVQHQALLQRQMRFGALAAIDLLSLLAGIVTAIVSAWYGAGYWALVFAQFATALANAAGVWMMCDWRPGGPTRNSGVRPMLALGGNLTGFSMVNYFARNLDNVLIGRFWGPQQLGLYAKAYQLLLLPIEQINSPVTAVVVPTLSRLVDSPERYRQAYLRILEKLTMLTMPGVAFMIATSGWLVQLVLGPKWMGVSPIFTLLGIAGLLQPVGNTVGWLFTTQGRTKRMFKVGNILGLIAIVSILAGLPWGAVGVAASYAIVDICIRTPFLFWFVGREGPVRTADFYRTIAPSGCAALGVLAVLLAARHWWLEGVNPLAGLGISFALAAGVTFVILALLPAGRRALQDMRSLVPLLVKREKPVHQ
ncbi:MAG TPA: lipopolysaccharide biosynthesis protein [Pyrinomonadaceae bacterium]